MRASARLLVLLCVLFVVACHQRHDEKTSTSSKTVAGECRRLELNASRTYSPSRWTDADQTVSPAITFALPAAVMVTSGAAAHQWSELQIQRVSGAWIQCRYDGTAGGDRYSFTSCSDGTVAGATVSGTRFKLHVQKGDHQHPAGETVVRVVLEDVVCDCNDNNPCTLDEGTAAGCTHAPVAAGADCSNGNPCDGAETCNASGSCTAGTPPVLDDSNVCTADACDPALGVTHTPVAAGTACGDGNVCNGAETCNAAGTCASGTALAVDDGNPCTTDACDAVTGVSHVNVAAGTSCSDGNVCNGAETCNGSGTCVAGTLPVINDGNPCTADACDPVTGISHANVAAGTACADGDVCNGAETCNGSGACVAGTPLALDDTNPCTVDTCHPTTGVAHAPTAAGSSCADGNVCNGAETCNGAGLCVGGTPLVLDDSNPCTFDMCDPIAGVSHSPVAAGTACADGNLCNGNETCNASGSCVAGTAPTVDDGNPCTTDACSAVSGVTHTPVAAGTACADGNACNGNETCNAAGSCVAGAAPTVDDGNPCTVDSCDPATGVKHVAAAVGTSCSDGDACNGLETCNATSTCVAAAAPTIDDGNPCTTDACDASSGVSHTAVAAGTSCADTNVCNGAETCNASGTCVGGTPLSTDDGNPCTTDACDPVTGVSHTPVATSTSCSDGDACNGVETCNAAGACAPGTAPTVDDGNPCTIDSCNAATGVQHVNASAGASCTDGNACNGSETALRWGPMGSCTSTTGTAFDASGPTAS